MPIQNDPYDNEAALHAPGPLSSTIDGHEQQQQQRQTAIHFTFPEYPVIHSGYSNILNDADDDDDHPSLCERLIDFVDGLASRYTEWVERQKVQMRRARRARGKSRPLAEIPFCIGTACAIYGTFLHVRGLAVNGWVVDHTQWDGTGHSFDRNPIVSMNTTETIAVSIGLTCGFMTWSLLVAKTRWFVYYASKWCVWLAGLQAMACLTSVYTFWVQESNRIQDPAHVYSRGFWSCLSAGILTLLGALGFAIDWFLGYPSSPTLSPTLRAMVLPAVMVCLTVICGASVFIIFEDWTYSESVVLCWVAVTTIGYGDIAPKTTQGRGFFIGYTIVGISVVGYMLLSIRAVITGSSSEILKVNLMRVESLQDYSREQHQKWLHHHQQHEQANSSSNSATQQDNNIGLASRDSRVIRRRQTSSTNSTSRPRSLSQASTLSAYTISNIINDKDRQILVQVITRSGIARMTYILILCWFGGAGVFCLLEENWTYLDSLYFAFCTQLTIGFGDIVPQSALAQEFWLVYIVISIAVAAYFISLFGDALIEKLQIQYGQDSDDDDVVVTPTSEGGISVPGYDFLGCDTSDAEDGCIPEPNLTSRGFVRSRTSRSDQSFVNNSQLLENPQERRTALNNERMPLVRYASMPTVSESGSMFGAYAKTNRRTLSHSARHPLHQRFPKKPREINEISPTASLPSIPFDSQPTYAAVEQSFPIAQSQEYPRAAANHSPPLELTEEDLLPDTETERAGHNRTSHHPGPKKSSKYIPLVIASAKNHR